jgi:hypothetical protein
MPNPNNVILLNAKLNAVFEVVFVAGGCADFLRMIGGRSRMFGVSTPVPHGVEVSSRSLEYPVGE